MCDSNALAPGAFISFEALRRCDRRNRTQQTVTCGIQEHLTYLLLTS